MNRIDHLVMYKSKSGRHFGRIYNRDEKNAENNKNRHNNRYTAFSSNRFLQLTPAKVTELVSNKHPNTSKENPQSKEANINRQKAFRDRFKQYLENKKQTKPTLKPFVSAVPIGRFIDDAIDTKKIKKNINMRSKKEAELVSQMSTPKKKIKNMEQVGVKFPSNTTTKKINRQGDPKIKLKIASTSNQKVSGLITSTVVKKKKNSTKATKMFNESISPVEEIREANEKQSKYSSVNTSAIEHENNTESGNLIVTPKNKEEGTSYYVSPFVTISRGARASFRKEKEARNVKYALESRKSFDLNQSIENRQKKEAAGYFRLQMQREKNQFDSLVTYWQKYAHENAIQSEYSDLIDVAIGQTKLLTTSKFKQFNNLIEQCENSEGDKVVKPEDLEVIFSPSSNFFSKLFSICNFFRGFGVWFTYKWKTASNVLNAWKC